MNQILRTFVLFLAVQLALVCGASAMSDGERKANPEALKAFTELVKSYRDRPALTVKSTIKIELSEGEASVQSKDVTGEFTFGQNRRAVVKLNDFVCYLNQSDDEPESGTITVVHAKSEDSYFTSSDDGSPYYALFHALKDMPFPELAIMLGEDDIDDVLLQFHPKALNGVTPTAVASKEKDGKTLQELTLTGDHETIQMVVDPESKLIQAMDVTIVGGMVAQADVAVTYKHTYEYVQHENPLDDSAFAFDSQQRQRVDMVASLLPKVGGPRGDGDDDEDGDFGHSLVGADAPGFVLATAEGKAVDLNDLRGRVVVLDFWASWCGPCMTALPQLHDVAKWVSAEQLPVSIYTVNVFEVRQNDSPDARLKSAKATWERRGFTLPIIMDYTDETAQAYGVRGIPALFIIRSDGVIHQVHIGVPNDYVEELKREIHEALKAVE